MVPAVQSLSSSAIEEDGVDSMRRRGVAGTVGRISSMDNGESVIGRFRSLQAAMMDKGDAHLLVRCKGARIWVLLQPKFFRYDLPRLVRGEIFVESLDEADDTLDMGDQASESLVESLEEDGGVSDASYDGNRICCDNGFNWKVRLGGCRGGGGAGGPLR